MSQFSDFAAALNQTIRVREDALPLRNEQCRTRIWLHSEPTEKVCLFFHGFTAGPFQFDPIGKAFYNMGYNVLIPRMPGHGINGEFGKDNPPPLPTQVDTYQQFALDWLKIAERCGKQVVIGGLSGGGTVAAWLTVNYPTRLYRSLLFAAYLSSSSKVLDLFVRNLNGYFEWRNPSPKRVGYGGFDMAALRTFLLMGQEILQQGRSHLTAPMFVLSSESDRAVGNRDHYALFESALKRQPLCWHHRFDRVNDVPHCMMTVEEGNRLAPLLITMSKAFVESNLTWNEVERIGYRMAQGRTFNDVVRELGLAQKASPDMPAMMTMVDKRSLLLDAMDGKRKF